MDKSQTYSQQIKSEALRLGFSDCGISKAGFLREEAENLKKWLEHNRHGEMQYMENHFEKRTDPRNLVDNAQSVISVLLNYYPAKQQRSDSYHISKYSYGKDYHFIMKAKLRELMKFIKDHIGEVSGRAFVDSAPVMDKAWAQRAGLGWIGKNTNLIHPKKGSYFFIGEVILDLELTPDTPIKDYCGNCTKCLEACPTGALTKAYQIDASRCLSYLTIEKKGQLPEQLKGTTQDWIFGCDICQDVCPWNKKAVPHQTEAFQPHPDLLSLTKTDWQKLSREHFKEIFRKSAVKRTKYDGLMRNIDFQKNNKSSRQDFE